MKRIVGIGSMLLVIIALAWSMDDRLNPTAQAWLDDTPPDSPAFRYFLALGAAPEKSAQAEGERLYQAMLAQPEVTFPNHWSALLQHPLLCDYRSAPSCLAKQKASADTQALLDEHAVLLERYLHLISLEEFANQIPGNRMIGTFPEYSLLIAASRLQSLKWLKTEDTAHSLQTEIRYLRQLLTGRHSLIGKLIVREILVEKIALAALLTQQGMPIHLASYQLNDAEKSLESAMKQELAMIFSLFNNLKNHPREEQESYPEYLARRLALRPNHSINHGFMLHEHYAELSLMPGHVIAADSFSPPGFSTLDTLRNPMGYFLYQTGTPDFKPYLIRMIHLDARLRLLGIVNGQLSGTPENPWAPESNRPVYSEHEVCFAFAPDTERYRSCLPLITEPPKDSADSPVP
ncbi:hypothetical protein [Alcanivorax profundi]|uniref:hypothetical protein n=1 Tax=Alcanivorax profundi TaxID=2338368 RepID=UPI0032B2F813